MITPIQTVGDVMALFPGNPQGIESRTKKLIRDITSELDTITSISAEQRTFDNTARAFDQAHVALRELTSALQTLEMASPDADLRSAAHDALIKLQDFEVDYVSQNKALYRAFKEYAAHGMTQESLSDQERYFIHDILKDFKRDGLNLPDALQEEVKKVKKAIAALELDFETNIATDNHTVTVSHDELAGLSEDFITSLKRTDDGFYVLGVDYPTYHQVLDHCSVESTREKLWTAFVNRAYPVNTPLLTKLIAERDKLAHLLGYSSYAEFDISNEMAKSPKNVEQFLDNLRMRAIPKVEQELNDLANNLPAQVSLTPSGKFKPWDMAYAAAAYKEQNFSLDERHVAEYFPLDHILQELLAIYEQFFSVKFSQLTSPDFWHHDVKLLSAHDAHGQLLGYLLLDLFPRPNKYTHACQIGIVPAIRAVRGQPYFPAVAVVLANFAAPTHNRPSLLPRGDVSTLFHEFGHALHTLFGATDIGSLSGTHVKRDFVELPSQMLEEWLWDPHILKQISSHYQTHEPLPDEMINKILKTKHFGTGNFVERQIALATIALDYYKEGADKEIYALAHDIVARIRPHLLVAPNDHFVASFGHLTGYGAKYYGYLWSRVYAVDLFDYIKQFGLLNPEIGKRYREAILSRGGAEDPYKLLEDFLGREPRSDAFFKDLGL